MIRRLRHVWYEFREALELRSQYDITFWDSWKIISWKPDPVFESDTPPDPHTLAYWRQEERRRILRTEDEQ